MRTRNKVQRQIEPDLTPIRTHFKQFWEADVTAFFSKLYQVGGLDDKTTELVVTSLLALRGWDAGVRTHTWQALEAGATPEEVRGAILISMSVGGINSAARGLAWADPVIQEYQQARTAPPKNSGRPTLRTSQTKEGSG